MYICVKGLSNLQLSNILACSGLIVKLKSDTFSNGATCISIKSQKFEIKTNIFLRVGLFIGLYSHLRVHAWSCNNRGRQIKNLHLTNSKYER